MMPRVLVSLLMLSALACSGKAKMGASTTPEAARPKALSQTQAAGGARCNANVPGRESSEYDTSGDDIPDVRKVFMRIGTGVNARLVMICRESDLNSDGRKDTIRYYDDEGRSLREDSDRNFDGKMDLITIYQDGKVVRKEFDDNYDGRLDLKIYYAEGKPLRAERDLKGRSTANEWRPDRWEYYEDGRIVRMGTDLDGDSRVDRWDRDQAFKRKRYSEEAEPEKEESTSGGDAGGS